MGGTAGRGTLRRGSLRCGVLAAGLGTNLIFFGITLVAIAVASTPFVLARRNRRH